MKLSFSPYLALALGCAISVAAQPSAAAVQVSVTNLVTDDQSAHAAQITDPGLVNGWGISFSPTSPFSFFIQNKPATSTSFFLI